MDTSNLQPGNRVRTAKDGKSWWTVQAAGSRYAILTRQAPFRPKGDYLYTIVDHEGAVRGPCNLIGNGWDVTAYPTPEIGWRLLHQKMTDGELEISHRRAIALDITEVAR